MDEFQRALAFIEDLEERAATKIVPFDYGRAFFNQDLPVVWDINFARVESEPDSWRALADQVDELQGQAGLSHRKMHLPDEAWVGELRDVAPGEGWQPTTLVFMVRRNEGDKSNGGRAKEVDYADVRRLRAEMAHRQPWATTEDDVRQVLDANRRWMTRAHGRFFAAEVDGKLVSAADLYRGPGLAQIEDVETLNEYRGRGLATDVVLEAAAAVEDPDATIFLIADENDWPKKLYERMGFETVGRKHQLLKIPN